MKVKWANMDYKSIVDANLLPEVEKHINGMGKFEADVYRVYLREWCGFPKNFGPELLPITPDSA